MAEEEEEEEEAVVPPSDGLWFAWKGVDLGRNMMQRFLPSSNALEAARCPWHDVRACIDATYKGNRVGAKRW